MNSLIQRLFIASTCVIGLASCGGGNDLASGSSAGVTSASAVTPSTSATNDNNSARTTISPTMAAIDNVGNGSRNATNIIKAAYWDNWTSSLKIPDATLKVIDIVLGAFPVLTSTSADPTMLSNFKQAYAANPNVKLFISLGGQNSGTPTIGQVPGIVSNIMSQVSSYNAALGGGKIAGIDLDLENGVDAATISAFALAFKQKGLLVSVAPQAYNSSGTGGKVASASPSNFNLTSGGVGNQYAAAVASGNVDYIFLQTYNTGGWTIDGCDETMTCFVGKVASTMANLVQPQSTCSAGTSPYPVCIPNSVKILITEPANSTSAGTSIFTGSPTPSGQATALSALNAEIANFPSQIAGVAMYELSGGSGDYASLNSSTSGAFSTAIFGAPGLPPPAPSSAFALTIKNTGTKNFVGVMIVSPIDATYNPIGDASNLAIAPGQSTCAGTSAANQTNPNCYSNHYLNTYFANSAASVTIPTIAVYDYSSATSVLNQPTNGWSGTACLTSTTFKANTTVTISVNGDKNTCTISSP